MFVQRKSQSVCFVYFRVPFLSHMDSKMDVTASKVSVRWKVIQFYFWNPFLSHTSEMDVTNIMIIKLALCVLSFELGFHLSFRYGQHLLRLYERKVKYHASSFGHLGGNTWKSSVQKNEEVLLWRCGSVVVSRTQNFPREEKVTNFNRSRSFGGGMMCRVLIVDCWLLIVDYLIQSPITANHCPLSLNLRSTHNKLPVPLNQTVFNYLLISFHHKYAKK